MRTIRTIGLAAGLSLALFGAARAADAAHPVVIELFQSQGCSSCPPADANVNALADRPDVLALNFAVTYWDDRGWKDTFAKPEFTARQYAYMAGLNHDEVATPEVVINGRGDVLGVDRRELEAAIHSAGAPAGATLTTSGNMVSIAAGAPGRGGADVWLVRYDPRVQWVAIRRGENGGKTLPHRDIVRELARLGHWGGEARSFTVSASADPNLMTAILVQDAHGGPILAATRVYSAATPPVSRKKSEPITAANAAKPSVYHRPA